MNYQSNMTNSRIGLSLTKKETEILFFSLLKSANEIELDHKQKKDGYTGKGIIKEIKELNTLKEKLRIHLTTY